MRNSFPPESSVLTSLEGAASVLRLRVAHHRRTLLEIRESGEGSGPTHGGPSQAWRPVSSSSQNFEARSHISTLLALPDSDALMRRRAAHSGEHKALRIRPICADSESYSSLALVAQPSGYSLIECVSTGERLVCGWDIVVDGVAVGICEYNCKHPSQITNHRKGKHGYVVPRHLPRHRGGRTKSKSPPAKGSKRAAKRGTDGYSTGCLSNHAQVRLPSFADAFGPYHPPSTSSSSFFAHNPWNLQPLIVPSRL